MPQPKATLYIDVPTKQYFQALALNRGLPGSTHGPSASAALRAIAAGELVVIGPFPSWLDLLSALATAQPLDAQQRAALTDLIDQIHESADLDADL